ncbi:MAG: NADAR family protein [Aeromonas popoffii]|uniref:NADAR family protein n=1 Tax=Aeromonas popoffii TaxID=70856 RepID=UPI003F3DA50C
MSAIISFSGNNRFLSNFYPSPIEIPACELDPCLEGVIEFPTVEHAYQASKFDFRSEEWTRIFEAKTPGAAKHIAATHKPTQEFLGRRNDIMRSLLHKKFAYGSTCAWLLMGTGVRTELVEGNDWGDIYWGRVFNDKGNLGEGQNILGRMLMNRRATLLTEFQENCCEFPPYGKVLLLIGSENKVAADLQRRIEEARKLAGIEE